MDGERVGGGGGSRGVITFFCVKMTYVVDLFQPVSFRCTFRFAKMTVPRISEFRKIPTLFLIITEIASTLFCETPME
jgi:hypothetical protein